MAARRAALGHPDLAARPGTGSFDGPTGSRVLGPNRLEQVEDVLGARCRPQGEEVVIRIGEGPAAADRHETRVALLREDHSQHPFRWSVREGLVRACIMTVWRARITNAGSSLGSREEERE
jgi:hypothetical protein